MSITAKRRFGQNFLHDTVVLSKINDKINEIIAQYSPQSAVEIGPGTGKLTELMVSKPISTTALEIDTEAFEYLMSRDDLSAVSIIKCDALEDSINPEGYLSQAGVLVSNLPFNVGSRILVNLGIVNPGIPFVVILQKEVAQKALRSSNFTLFGAWLNLFWETKIAFDIPRNSYVPAPDVATSVLVGEPKSNLQYPKLEERKKMLAKLKILFSHPRKTVRANLKYGGYESSEIESFFDNEGWDLSLRLTWENYKQVLIAISNTL